MKRDEREYQALSAGYDFLFDEYEIEIQLALGQIQGVIIEMWSIMNGIKDITSDRFLESKNRWLVLHKAYRVCERLLSHNIMLKHKLLLSENELSNYQFIHKQMFGDAKRPIRNDNTFDTGISYPDW